MNFSKYSFILSISLRNLKTKVNFFIKRYNSYINLLKNGLILPK
jgi:hypothetical protein